MEVWQNNDNVVQVPISQYDFLYHNQDGNPRTSLTTSFFSCQNLQRLMAEIGHRTGVLLNRKGIVVVPNLEFFTYLEETVRVHAHYALTPKTLSELNEMIIVHEVGVQYRGLRRRELFFKWFWFKDRPRVISRPEDTHGRRRYDRLDTGAYGLTSPSRSCWQKFRAEQQAMACANYTPDLFQRYYQPEGWGS